MLKQQDFSKKISDIFNSYHLTQHLVKIVAVTKTVSQKVILEAINNGYTCFAENYLQEAKQKWPHILQQNQQLELQFIGGLQSNKIKEIVKLFDTIATLNNKKNAILLKQELINQQKSMNIFIQVNIGCEPQKQGVKISELVDFYNFCQDIKLSINGLMCILPITKQPAPYFALMQKMSKQLNLRELSMGMSGDFMYAIPFGCTQIRLGQAIFGVRS